MAVVRRWESLRSATDTMELWTASRAAGRLRDARVFEALAKVADDRDANVIARISAVRGLLLMLSPGRRITVADLRDPDGPCMGSETVLHDEQETVRPLSANYQARLRQIAASIRRSPEIRRKWQKSRTVCKSTPNSVRSRHPLRGSMESRIRRTFQILAEGDGDSKVRDVGKRLSDLTASY